jgi:hypothetical protein
VSEVVTAMPRPKRKRKAKPTNPYGFVGPHVLKALAYIDDVIEGRVPACKWTRLACERQRRDSRVAHGPGLCQLRVRRVACGARV